MDRTFPAAARRLLAISIVARLPPAMLSIAILIHAQHLTGSFAAAGIVTGAYAVALGVGGPLLGGLIDRRGPTSTLLVSALVAGTLLVAAAMLPVGTSTVVLAALAAGIGLSTPPVGACLRSQLPALVPDPGAVRTAYAFEASVIELTYIAGPPLALCIGALWSTGGALAIIGVALLVATAVYAAQPASRHRRPARTERRQGGGSMRGPGMRTLAIVLLAVGTLLGADEVAVTVAAKGLSGTTAAAPLFAIWGAGSFVGGFLAARLGARARRQVGLGSLLTALTIAHLALIPVDGSLLALGAVLFLAGATVAPTEATVYAMVEGAAPAGTITEAFAWLATAMAIGAAVGAAGAGIVADSYGKTAAFALAGAAGAIGVIAVRLRARALAPRRPPESDATDAHPPLRGAVTLLVDLALPTALFYGLRAVGVDQVAALLIAGAPPALRIVFTLVRHRRIDSMGALVLAAVALTAVGSLTTGSPRTLLVRNAIFGIPFGLWMLASLRACRPLTYELAKSLLPSKDRAFEQEWTQNRRVRRVWRRLTVLWGCGLLIHAGISVAMAATLAVEVVPGLETGVWLMMFVVLQVITQVALFRTGTMRRIMAGGP